MTSALDPMSGGGEGGEGAATTKEIDPKGSPGAQVAGPARVRGGEIRGEGKLGVNLERSPCGGSSSQLEGRRWGGRNSDREPPQRLRTPCEVGCFIHVKGSLLKRANR